jgi:hypothetical protein
VLKRLRPPDYVAGIFGLALLASLFAPWYELSDSSYDGWRSLAFIDVWLLLTALLAIAIPLVTAAKDSPALPIAVVVITAWVALIATILVLYRVASPPSPAGAPSDDRGWGLWLALVSVIGTFAGTWWAMRLEDAPGLRPPPEVRAMPAPPASDPVKPPT